MGIPPQARAAWIEAGGAEPELMVSPADNSIGYRHHAVRPPATLFGGAVVYLWMLTLNSNHAEVASGR